MENNLSFYMKSFLILIAFPIFVNAENCVEIDRFEKAVCLHGNQEFGQAFPLMEAEAKNGNNGAQLILADMYMSGKGVDRNFDRAVYWAERAFFSNARGAARRLADYYSTRKKDGSKYIGWLAVASEEGDPNAAERLGDIYFKGTHGEKNYCLANFWYKQALKQTELPTTIEKLSSDSILVIREKNDQSIKNCEKSFSKN